MPSRTSLVLLSALTVFPWTYSVAAEPAPPPDVLIFSNGEKLIGHLVRSTGASVTFKSDMAGEITVDWSKVKEFQSTREFVVVPRSVTITHGDYASLPKGKVMVADKKIEVVSGTTAEPRKTAIDDTSYVIDQETFQNAVVHEPTFTENWNGSITGGGTLVQATQSSRAFNSEIHLIRAVPLEGWLDTRNRTTANLSATYGTLRQPGTPNVKTEVYHLDGEQDRYFSPRLYVFGQLALDHNFSQGLDLQQNYGLGIGWTVIKNASNLFDLKASATYIRQQFQTGATNDQNLIGSTFSESYYHKFKRGMIFQEQTSLTVGWNNLDTYSGTGTVSFTVPIYKRFSLSFGSLDSFLNDPPPGFKKNSFQVTTGFTYTLR